MIWKNEKKSLQPGLLHPLTATPQFLWPSYIHDGDDRDLVYSITDHRLHDAIHSEFSVSFRVWNPSCEAKQIIKKATHLRLSIFELSWHCISCSETRGCCRMAAEIVSAWDYITEFDAFTQRISPSTVWPSGLKSSSFTFENNIPTPVTTSKTKWIIHPARTNITLFACWGGNINIHEAGTEAQTANKSF